VALFVSTVFTTPIVEHFIGGAKMLATWIMVLGGTLLVLKLAQWAAELINKK